MRIERYRSDNYRNLKPIEFQPADSVNVLFGENAQGKTNIIESIWLFTGCQSFRTRKCRELVGPDGQTAKLELDFFADGREQTVVMTIGDKREVLLNGIKLETPRKLLGSFPAFVFSPSSLSIVRDGPSEKRKFLDIAISVIKPGYAAALSRYIKTMAHRNAMLRALCERGGDERVLDALDEQLSALGAGIIANRMACAGRIFEKARAIYEGISSGREVLDCKYIPGFKTDAAGRPELTAEMLRKLTESRDTDIRRQMTGAGPHKDDIQIDINGLCARAYGSQGQQRSCALALKLAEAAVIEELCGEKPVALLDDVMSELDCSRQSYLLGFFSGWQVFITCCDPSVLSRVESGKTFEIKAGDIVGETKSQ